MNTTAGFAAFLMPKVNLALADILNEWARYLRSADSTYALSEDASTGWFGEYALAAMFPDSSDPRATFVNTFVCDPALPHYGFKSWDDFFTRKFRAGVRPIASPDDFNVIVNACESAPFGLVTGVKLRDTFWCKGYPYSLSHMMAEDPLVEQFVGGTVYQAFLSAMNYHCWHAPVRFYPARARRPRVDEVLHSHNEVTLEVVRSARAPVMCTHTRGIVDPSCAHCDAQVSGTIVRAYVVPGTYYSASLEYGFGATSSDPDTPVPDPSAPNDSQVYLAEMATRCLIFIQADNPAIGLMCFIGIGMAEVSTCDITVYEGQHVTKVRVFHVLGCTCLDDGRGHTMLRRAHA